MTPIERTWAHLQHRKLGRILTHPLLALCAVLLSMVGIGVAFYGLSQQTSSVQHAVARNDQKYCDQERALAALPTQYPPPSSDLAHQLVATVLHIQASAARLVVIFGCDTA